MIMGKKLRSALAIVLTLIMIIGMMPNAVLAATANGLVPGETKATISAVIVQEDANASGSVKFSEVSAPSSVATDDEFYVAIKASDLDHIQDLNSGFQSVGIAMFWDKTYVELLDISWGALDETAVTGRTTGKTAQNRDGLYFSPSVVTNDGSIAPFDYYAYGAFTLTENATPTVDDGSKLTTTNASKLQFDIKHYYTTNTASYGNMNPTFKGADFYAAILKFKALKDAPTDGNGAQIFDFSVDRSDAYIDFGTANDKVHYEYSDVADSRMQDVIEYSTADADIYPSTYPVYYDANVGSLTLNNVSINGGDTTVETGRTMTALANGIADGYKVTSWNTAADGTGTTIVVGDAGTKIDRNMISTYTKEGETDEETGLHLYAQWESLYAVTFDGNGGADGSNKTSRSYDFATSVTGTLNTVDGTQDKNGVTVDLPDINNAGNEFTRTGYDFDGWYKADNSGYYTVGTRIIDWADVTVGSATYFINWNSNLLPEDQSIVTFDANGTTWDDMDDVKSVTVNTGDMINPNPSTSTLAENMPVPPTRTGYVFKGWNTQANGAGTDFTGKTVVDGDMDVYAVWELAPDVAPENTVVINFDLGLDGKTVPNQPTITKNPYNVYVAAEGGSVAVDASIIPTLSSESIQEADGKEWSFVGWQITDIGGNAPATTTMYEVGATFNAVAGGITNVTVTALWGETKRITLHLGNLTAAELAAAGLDSEEVVLRGVNGQDLTQSADYKKLITSVNATATTIGESKLHGHWEFVALSSVPRAQADVTKLYEAVTDIKFADEPEVYAFWQLSLSVAASEDVSLTYTGAALDWNADPAAPAIDIWYGDSLDNETGKYTARANGDLTLDTHYEVEIYNSDDTEPRTELPEIKDVINYLVNFVSLKPAGDTGIEKYDPIVFEDDSVDLNIEPMAVKVKVNSVTGGSKGTAPDSGTTSGAALTVGDGKGIEVVEPDTLYTPEMKAAIEAAIEVKYRLLNEGAPTVGTTYDTADLSTGPDASGTEDDPYALGNYIMVIGAKGNSNFKVTEVEFAAATGAAALTSPDDITPNLANNLGITDGSHTAAIYTVEISNLTVTFKYPTAMPENSSDPVNLDGTATVEVEKGTTIKDATDPNVEMPTLDKITDYQCEGWFVATGADDAALYASAKANYNTWKADKDANAALKFDEKTVVNNDVTVVAIWVTSQDGTLVPDDKGDEDPSNDVPALAVKVYKDDGNANGTPAKGEDGTTDIAETITEFKQNDYTTAQVFTPNDTSIEYYLRVDNKYDYAEIQWNTAENRSTVEIKKNDGEGNYVTVASYVVGELSVMAQGSKSVVLDVADQGSANDFQIVVTPPDTTATPTTYKLHVQRLNDVGFKLNYGNSPYGMIMKDPTVNESNSLYGSTDADAIAQWQTNAKAAFDEGNRFTSTYMPKDAINKIYHTNAWDNATDADHNMDRNDYAIFVYNRTDFRDPGFELRDALGNLVDGTQVTRYVENLQRSAASIAGLAAPTTTERFELPAGADNMLYTTITDKNGSVQPVKPGVYKLHYEYLDKSIDPDGVLIKGVRYLVVLSMIGDADFSGGVNTSDGTTINALSTGATYNGLDNFFRYRIVDTDNSGGVNTSDTTTVNSISTGNSVQPFYNSLPDT